MTYPNKRKFDTRSFFLNKGHNLFYGDTNMTARPERQTKT